MYGSCQDPQPNTHLDPIVDSQSRTRITKRQRGAPFCHIDLSNKLIDRFFRNAFMFLFYFVEEFLAPWVVGLQGQAYVMSIEILWEASIFAVHILYLLYILSPILYRLWNRVDDLFSLLSPRAHGRTDANSTSSHSPEGSHGASFALLAPFDTSGQGRRLQSRSLSNK